MDITLYETAEILALARGKAEELCASATIAVLTASGNLHSFERVDGNDALAIIEAIAYAQGVRSAVRVAMAGGPYGPDLPNGSEPTTDSDALYLPLALPIYRDNLIIGYIGVAGASVTQNLVIALSGASLYSRSAYREN